MDKLVQQLNDDMAAVAQTVRQSLVQITNGRGGAGAGTIWHSDGLIVTNAHVVAAHHTLNVTLSSGETYPARVLAASESLDLAALMVEASDLPTIELGDSRHIQPGQWVMSMGHPWGVINAATGGIVISMGKRLGDIEFRNGQDWIAVNLKLRPGHSGGPMVDAQGRLLGVNTIMNGPEVGIAIPVHVVKSFLKEHLSTKETPVAV
ncbi:MAG: S1C family serine protease [Anaerolineae bacterium]|nr:S1C family serine protease [Anaerolineae bacterium]